MISKMYGYIVNFYFYTDSISDNFVILGFKKICIFRRFLNILKHANLKIDWLM